MGYSKNDLHHDDLGHVWQHGQICRQRLWTKNKDKGDIYTARVFRSTTNKGKEMLRYSIFVITLALMSLHAHDVSASNKQRVVLKDGSIFHGYIKNMDGKWVVLQTSGGRLRIPAKDIKGITFLKDSSMPTTRNPTQKRSKRVIHKWRQKKIRRGLIVGGLTVLTLSYSLGALGSFAVTSSGLGGYQDIAAGFLMLPVLGPFVSAGIFAANRGSGDGIIAFVVLGVLQTGGLGLLLAGIFGKKPKDNKKRMMQPKPTNETTTSWLPAPRQEPAALHPIFVR
ncbi:MAG: hypothetical protein CL920_31705 [Deltaproteobacteria bacterium]|nr:hypothetical protein [Deltaproteobacteria bacterium]MBU53285.1 hypothetical protein [Deltaproteobacteria bacterium]